MEPQCRCLLIVEDDVLISLLLSDALEDDYNVICAASNQEALAILVRQRIDVILYDCRLCDVHGESLVRRAGNAAIPMVGMTDRTSDFKRTGTVHHPMLLKPFTLATALTALAKVRAGKTGIMTTDRSSVVQFKSQ